MKKKSVLMFGVAAVFSSALFAGSAFAKTDEDRGDDKNTYVAPAFQFVGPVAHADAVQPVKPAPTVVKEREDRRD